MTLAHITFAFAAIGATIAWASANRPTAASVPPASTGQAPEVTAATGRPLRVVVSIAPLRGLIQPLLPGGSTVDILIPPGASEHGYEIPPAKLAAISQADLVVTIGLGLEPQIDRFLTRNPSVTRLTVSMADLVDVQDEDHANHAHDPNGECVHSEEGSDPHLWLDPGTAKKFVEKLAPRLAERFPAPLRMQGATSEHPILTAAKLLIDRIDAIDAAYRMAADNAETRTLVVGHDAYGWLARRYSLSTVAVAGLNAQEPTYKAIQAAIAAIHKHGAKAVFVEPQLAQGAGKRIAQQTNVPVLTLDPLGDGDWFRMMEANLESLKRGLGQKVMKTE